MKNLILLLDGTWNDIERGDRDTNIVRLRTIIDNSLDQGLVAHGPAEVAKQVAKFASGRGFHGNSTENIVFYERGVGTGPLFDAVGGGAFGDGLEDNIRRAYKFLSFHYEHGDRIYIFGFSRGAYTARTLGGYLHVAGLLTRESCTPELEQAAWHFYRTAPHDRLPGAWSALTPYVQDRALLKIECMAVFDTVGALGIPMLPFWWQNRERYGFHNVELNSIIRHNLQALAIDEHRAPFEAAPWRKMPFKHYLGTVEQVWFAGCHSDIGGSNIVEATRDSVHPHALDDIALDWMLKRLHVLCPEFPLDFEKAWTKKVGSAWSLAQLHESRSWLYKPFRFTERAISNIKPEILPWRHEGAGNFDRHGSPFNEAVHVSAIERLGAEAIVDEDGEKYLPRNLIAVFPHICATYDLPGTRKPPLDIFIVDWDGRRLDPLIAGEQQRALNLLSAAASRLGPLAKG